MAEELTAFQIAPEQAAMWATAAGLWTQGVAVLPGDPTPDRVAAAIDRVVRRYEILRTGFVDLPLIGSAGQVIHEPGTVAAVRVEPASDVESALRAQRAPVDLDRPPLLRCALAGRRLVLSAPTMVLDAVGLGRLVAELGTDGYREVLQYADYAQWRLDQPVDDLLALVPAPAPAATARFDAAALRAVADEHGVPLWALLMSAWWLVVDTAGLTGDGGLALAVDGRRDIGAPAALGWFEHHVAVRPSTARTLAGMARENAGRLANASGAAVGFRYVDLPAGVVLDRLTVDTSAAPVQLTAWPTGLWLTGPAHLEMGTRLEGLLAELAAEPALAVPGLDLRTPAEQAVTQRRNATDEPPAPGPVQRFRSRVTAGPDAIAVVGPDAPVTYRELDERACRVAGELHRRGTRRGDRVGILVRGVADQLAAVLGCWYAGAAFVALNPDDPRVERLAIGCRTVLDDVPPEGADAADPVDMARDEVAYVAYTSGSTGTPQGVLATGRGLANYLAYLVGEYELDEHDVVLQLAPFTFDAWLRNCLGPLTVGASVVDAGERGVEQLVELIAGARVTRLLHVVPTVLRELARTARDLAIGPTALRTVLSSGEPIRGGDAVAVRAAFGDRVRVVNQYGPTECTLTSTFGPVPGDDSAQPAPIGRPIRNMRLHLLDELLRPVPVGVAGEVYLGGDGLALGYLDQPARTAGRFVPDPFGERPGGRLYRTGDRARQRLDGEIELIGRRDGQLKIRGVRIEPAEVETVLRQHPDVHDAAVVDAGGLVAGVVVAGGGSPPTRAWLLRRLPAYLVPARLVALDALPRNRHGKLDRRALADRLAAETGTAAAPPTDPVQRAIVEVFARTLSRDGVDVDADFFALGGHSLLATQAVHRLNQTLGRMVPLRAIFEAPTARALAARMQAEHTSRPGSTQAITRLTGDGPFPLSYAQRRLWLVDALHPVDTSHNVQVTARIGGVLVPDVLRRALAYLGERHEMLRTAFVAGPDGEPAQHVHETVPVELDVCTLDPDRAAEELSRYSREQANTAFDLTRPPLWRVGLVTLAPDENRLLLTAHHIIIDEWSVGVLLRDLVAAYTALLGGGTPQLAALPLRYLDFAAWQRDRLTGERLAGLLEHWRDRIADAAFELELPVDFPRPQRPSPQGDRIAVPLSRDLVHRLTAVGQAEGATLYMVLLGVFATLLAHYGRRDDIVLGTPVANRDDPALDEVVGCFVNILVLRVRLDGARTFTELLRRVRATALDAFAHQEAPFEQVVEAVRPSRALGRIPLVQNWFVLHNAAQPVLRAPGFELTLVESDRGSSKFDLNLALSETGAGLSAALEYSTDLFRRETGQRLLDRYRELLEWVAAEPAGELAQLRRRIDDRDGKERLMAVEDRNQSRHAQFAALRARPVTPVRLDAAGLVHIGPLSPGGDALPALVTPRDGRPVDLAGWAASNRDTLTGRLRRDGAILFRGFDIGSVEAFEEVVRAHSPAMLDYYERSTPRQVVSGKVYSSTEYPPERTIPLHPESAYSHYWPRTLWFCCLTASDTGGATPLADSRRILAELPPDVRERFGQRKLRYVRTYHEGFDIPWQTAFQTEDRAVVERYCRDAGMTWQWRDDGVLRTEHVLDAVVRHPDTDEEVWFNQVHAWHLSALEPAAQQAMRSTFGDDLPRMVTYGDGAPIDDAAVTAVRTAHERALVRFPWQPGDCLLIDNMLVAHGRDPYTGRRRVVVAMSDPYNRDQLR